MRLPCHVAKEGTKKIPFIGTITKGISTLYVERENKEKKKGLVA